MERVHFFPWTFILTPVCVIAQVIHAARHPSQSLLKIMSLVCGAIQSSHPLPPPFSSFPQSFPASGSFPVSQIFALGGQNIGASASAPVLPMTPRTDLL